MTLIQLLTRMELIRDFLIEFIFLLESHHIAT